MKRLALTTAALLLAAAALTGCTELLRPGEKWTLDDGSTLEFVGTKPYITLAVRHAPGQTLLLVASGTLLLGLMGSLFARRRRVWFRVSPPEGGSPTSGSSLVEAGGLPRTEHPGFADEFAQLVAAVSGDAPDVRRAREGDD